MYPLDVGVALGFSVEKKAAGMISVGFILVVYSSNLHAGTGGTFAMTSLSRNEARDKNVSKSACFSIVLNALLARWNEPC